LTFLIEDLFVDECNKKKYREYFGTYLSPILINCFIILLDSASFLHRKYQNYAYDKDKNIVIL